jgi:hypothetical protein
MALLTVPSAERLCRRTQRLHRRSRKLRRHRQGTKKTAMVGFRPTALSSGIGAKFRNGAIVLKKSVLKLWRRGGWEVAAT